MASNNVRKRTVHQLDTPFSTTQWPEVSQDDQDTILELLFNLLTPIGNHRKNHVKFSKGKRKPQAKEAESTLRVPEDHPPSPPVPEVAQHIDVGFNSVTRGLEASSRAQDDRNEVYDCYFAVFVCRGDQSKPFNSHFPQMVGVSNKHSQPDRSTRLVGLSRPCSEKISSCLGLARVSCLGIRSYGSVTEPLQELVERLVPSLQVPWYNEAKGLEYRKTQINAIETIVGAKRKKT